MRTKPEYLAALELLALDFATALGEGSLSLGKAALLAINLSTILATIREHFPTTKNVPLPIAGTLSWFTENQASLNNREHFRDFMLKELRGDLGCLLALIDILPKNHSTRGQLQNSLNLYKERLEQALESHSTSQSPAEPESISKPSIF